MASNVACSLALDSIVSILQTHLAVFLRMATNPSLLCQVGHKAAKQLGLIQQVLLEQVRQDDPAALLVAAELVQHTLELWLLLLCLLLGLQPTGFRCWEAAQVQPTGFHCGPAMDSVRKAML